MGPIIARIIGAGRLGAEPPVWRAPRCRRDAARHRLPASRPRGPMRMPRPRPQLRPPRRAPKVP